MEGSSLLYVTTLPDLVAIGIVVVEKKKLSRDVRWPRVQRAVWLDGLKFLTVSHYYAKFYGPRPRGNSDTATKIIYVTLQDHLIKGYADFVEGNSSLYIPTLPKLIIIDIVFMDIQLF